MRAVNSSSSKPALCSSIEKIDSTLLVSAAKYAALSALSSTAGDQTRNLIGRVFNRAVDGARFGARDQL